ncbi:PorT family protein [Bacteroides cellulosilyticus]|nr:PorT family protein [Bacteroides cellulosilyticus]
MDAETKKHYKLPVRTGIRVSVPLTEALAVESGITYTLLSSSMESGSKENYYHTEQTLHYVGIPLKLRYKLWNSKRIGIYVSGGGMVEKCVSGKAKTKFVIGGSKNSIEEQKVSEKPLQLSATLSAGIEANIAKNTCLFIEPGASYYIDNHSSVDNVYKDKPFNLDLNIGIRININK